MDEPIIDELRRRIRELPPSEWEAHAVKAGVAISLPRKLAYGERNKAGPGVVTIQPLLSYLRSLDTKAPAVATASGGA